MSLIHFCMGFEAFTSVAKTSAFFWEVKCYCQVETYQHFGKKLLAVPSVYFYSEDGYKTFLRNVRQHDAKSKKTAVFISVLVRCKNTDNLSITFSRHVGVRKVLSYRNRFAPSLTRGRRIEEREEKKSLFSRYSSDCKQFLL
jgi:hypothetical protein